jgi:hypothetical protein
MFIRLQTHARHQEGEVCTMLIGKWVTADDGALVMQWTEQKRDSTAMAEAGAQLCTGLPAGQAGQRRGRPGLLILAGTG